MNNYTTVVGLDVHKESIVAVVLPRGHNEVSEKVSIDNHPKAIAKLVNRITKQGPVEFVYEAGPCGYQVQRQIAGLGQHCAVIAPGLTPVRPGDRVKTDKRDAVNLARFYRSGDLTEIRVPTCEEEAARDLPRAREDALADRLRARHRLSKFLLRQGRTYRETKSWGVAHKAWIKTQKFEFPTLQQTFEADLRALDEAEARLETLNQQTFDLAQRPEYRKAVNCLRALKGIDTLGALILVAEAQDFRRFSKASEFMSFTGLVGSEFSSGEKVRRGSITKAGNAHIRRVLVEAAWSQRYPDVERSGLAERRKGCPREVVQIAKKAQARLHRKFLRMTSRNKLPQVTVVAVARELAGFVWSIGQHIPAAVAV
jgi:transposase